ncbi:NADH dehydrogenase (ubiquinone) 1 beta subcomplex, 2, 8kDa [Calliopsis andreniformis]|uniref:NADH dehydrogenase (ubiquinone) 1 beta subcomplex, 2, 8kDa n=1 Tax=Calliopsis andreniformis TaxID=337506 RepID=UPI003FCEC66B
MFWSSSFKSLNISSLFVNNIIPLLKYSFSNMIVDNKSILHLRSCRSCFCCVVSSVSVIVECNRLLVKKMFSHGRRILQTVNSLYKTKNAAIILKSVRQSHGTPTYREQTVPPKHIVIWTEILGGIFWWWILWNFYHDWHGALMGHYVAPIPEHWTDEELGIPPEDE